MFGSLSDKGDGCCFYTLRRQLCGMDNNRIWMDTDETEMMGGCTGEVAQRVGGRGNDGQVGV
jgi:hypothetical protein